MRKGEGDREIASETRRIKREAERERERERKRVEIMAPRHSTKRHSA